MDGHLAEGGYWQNIGLRVTKPVFRQCAIWYGDGFDPQLDPPFRSETMSNIDGRSTRSSVSKRFTNQKSCPAFFNGISPQPQLENNNLNEASKEAASCQEGN